MTLRYVRVSVCDIHPIGRTRHEEVYEVCYLKVYVVGKL